jgi:hypothetical protein
MFKFKDTTSAGKVREIEASCASLPGKIALIQDFEWGTNNSPEGKAQGFTHCFTLTFKSAEDRDAYIPHPDHKAFVGFLDGCVEKVLVLDYWTD